MDYLFQKVDIRQLAIFRMLVGAWFFVDCIGMLVIGYVKEAYVDPPFNFAFYGLEWVTPLPGFGMYIHFLLLSVCALGIMLGYRYRLSVILFFVGYLYVFLLDITYTLNKFYLFLILAFLLIFIDAHRYWSYDVRRNSKLKRDYTPRWTLLIFIILIGIIYTFSGIAKINLDWILYQEPLRTFFGRKTVFTFAGPGVFNIIVYTFSILGILFDLTIIWLLIYRRTNKGANIIQGLFHSLNFFILSIGTLSIFTALVTWLLYPTTWLKRKLHLKNYHSELIYFTRPKKILIASSLVIFLIINLLVPNRHYLSGNNVNWTEKGHRFSWRLMTRTKSGSNSRFTVIDDDSKEEWEINPRSYLTPRQYRKMSAETDLVISFAHYLEVLWIKKGYPNVAVKARVNTRLNGRNTQVLVDPELDLTRVKRTFLKDEISTQLLPRD